MRARAFRAHEARSPARICPRASSIAVHACAGPSSNSAWNNEEGWKHAIARETRQAAKSAPPPPPPVREKTYPVNSAATGSIRVGLTCPFARHTRSRAHTQVRRRAGRDIAKRQES